MRGSRGRRGEGRDVWESGNKGVEDLTGQGCW